MAFESISQKYEFTIAGFPEEWLPLIYLYDPDLPLFPVVYFHCINSQLPPGHRPGEHDRVFGFVHHLNVRDGFLDVTVALNKDLKRPQNEHYKAIVEKEVRARLGLGDPVRLADLKNSFSGKLSSANQLIEELWYQVVEQSFGKALPFGSIWDPVFGLVRFIASWNSDGGRKGELIQTHYFAAAFGEHIQTGGDIHVDFYLLPTFAEFSDLSNPLVHFPNFAELIEAAAGFTGKYCSSESIGSNKFSRFKFKDTNAGKRLDTGAVLKLINAEAGQRRRALFENYSAFNRGPHRSVMALMMMHDLRQSDWRPDSLSATDCAAMYDRLERTYQSPKVIQLYAQQCFGAKTVLPIDAWVATFVRWPLGFRASKPSRYHEELFACASNWGKIERLVWLAAQARKVHSSICAEILWCIRYGNSKKDMRGANPLSCKICMGHIRKVCPAYKMIAETGVVFNSAAGKADKFEVRTSAANNTASAQTIVSCQGPAGENVDEYSPRDRPNDFKPFPIAGHNGEEMTAESFIARY